MSRYNQKYLAEKIELFSKLAQFKYDEDDSAKQQANEENPEDMELKEEKARLERRLKQINRKLSPARNQPAPSTDSPQAANVEKTQRQIDKEKKQESERAAIAQSPEQLIINGLKQDIYSEVSPAGQYLKGKFNQNFNSEISKIFNEELFDHAAVGRSDRDEMRKFVSLNRIKLIITVNAATHTNANIDVRFWATDPSFTQKYPKQTSAASNRLTTLLKGSVYNTIQSTAQTSGLTEPTKAPIVINTYFSVTDNDNDPVYTQL